jgi:hypothetical protein
MDLIDKIMAYEQGEMDDEKIVEMFQEMINDGSVWKLQGSYGRMASALIDSGHCVLPVGSNA